MFWKLIEIIVRIIYWRRFRTAKKIGEAATLLSQGRPEAALQHLEKHGSAIHQSLLPLFALTQGKIYDALGRYDEAENSFKAVVLTNPTDARADVELAVLTGKQFRFSDCRTWLTRAIEKNTAEMTPRAREILKLLDDIESGAKQQEYETRAMAMARKPLLDGKALGLPPDLALIETWCHQPEATETIDDLALLLALNEVQKGGRWKIGLSIEDTVVIGKNDEQYRPFDVLAQWLPSALTSK